MSLEWNGPEVLRLMGEAALTGINATMAQAVEHAKRNHEWINRTGTLEGSIAIAEYAHKAGRAARGLWGSKDVNYALTHELGDPSRKIPKRAYLRPAADAEYPDLAANIRRAYARQ